MGLFRAARRGVTFAAVVVGGGALVVTARHLLETPQPLMSELRGEAAIDRKHGGDIYYTVAGPREAAPIVLLHDFYTGASNFEFREVFSALAERYRVYAPDWLGFGMSERPRLTYTGEFYASMLTGFVRDVVARPTSVIANGRAANIAVRAASDTPSLFDRLTLVTPYATAGLRAEPSLAQTLARATQRAALGVAPYAALSSRSALRWTGNSRSARPGSGAGEERAVAHRYASAHQFGGQHALLTLLTGELDLPMRNAFALLDTPILIVGGASDSATRQRDLTDLAALNTQARLTLIPDAGASVYEDQPEAFVAAVTTWLSAAPDAPALAAAGGASDAAQPAMQAAQAAATQNAGQSAPALAAEQEEPLVGTPGYVTPGVSDMGQDGPATVTMGGVANAGQAGTERMERAEEMSAGATVTLGAGEMRATAGGEAVTSDAPDALLPEAGATNTADVQAYAAQTLTPDDAGEGIVTRGDAAQDAGGRQVTQAGQAGQAERTKPTEPPITPSAAATTRPLMTRRSETASAPQAASVTRANEMTPRKPNKSRPRVANQGERQSASGANQGNEGDGHGGHGGHHRAHRKGNK